MAAGRRGMPGGARRSLASPVVSGVLCQCGGPPSGAAPEGGSGSPPPSLVDQERRLHSLFLQLDVNRDGALCVHDLAVGLGRLGLHRSEGDLRVSLRGRSRCTCRPCPAPRRP